MTAAYLEVAPVASTLSRPLVYNHYLLTEYEQEEEALRDIEVCNTMVPIINHRLDHQVPRYLIPHFRDDGPWEIKKVLTKSDVGSLYRLLLSHTTVEKYIFSYWGVTFVNRLKFDGHYVNVSVREFDTARVHKLVFRKWRSNNSYIFQGGWYPEFVRPMSLKAGDEIGMFWNSKSNFFVFKLLKKHS